MRLPFGGECAILRMQKNGEPLAERNESSTQGTCPVSTDVGSFEVIY